MATAVFTFLTRRHHHPSSGALFLRFLVNKAFPDLVLAPIGLLAYQNGHILLIAKTDNASFIFGVPFSFEMFLFNRLARHIVEFFFRFIFFYFLAPANTRTRCPWPRSKRGVGAEKGMDQSTG